MAHRCGATAKTWITAIIALLMLVHLVRYSPPRHNLYGFLEQAASFDINSTLPNPPFIDTFAYDLDPFVYDPYPRYNSVKWSREWRGKHMPCNGPRGVQVNNDPEDMLLAQYRPVKEAVERPFIGSYEDTNLDRGVCIDGRARYSPYGFEDEDLEVLGATEGINWTGIDWGQLQQACIKKNEDRYEDTLFATKATILSHPTKADFDLVDEALHFPDDRPLEGEEEKGCHTRYKDRNAIVFHIPASTEWSIDSIQYLRSLIVETCLHTGGEYEVMLLIRVSDSEGPIFNNPGIRRRVLERLVPPEFQHLAVLFNRRLLRQWYPHAQHSSIKNGSSFHEFQVLQLLSIARPDIEYFWLLDIATRYIGHHYDFLEKVAAWSRNQPRDISWQRAPLTYVPSIHKTWANFSNVAQKQSATTWVRGANTTSAIIPIGPRPPFSFGWNDGWGRGEEADLVAIGPIFDPFSTRLSEDTIIVNYPGPRRHIPRRAILHEKFTRTSKRLLRAMHHGQVTLGVAMSMSMYPASTALHHGLKVVSFPIPIFSGSDLSAQETERAMNRNLGRDSFSVAKKYQHDWRYLTLSMMKDEFPTYGDELYKRWLGYDAEATQGLCLPGMLLGPIKGV